ncbi:MAG TPA: Txe/YoeB family addiction module toxin, partial [Bacteroidetes bacterium]|nr:Txe/YoeB family addiction module toxin [Bacteroidota bacterium]
MKIEFTEKAWADFEYWMIHEPDMAMKIKELLRAISENPFQGIGKPEPLKYSL